jgi:hypothetical protein
MAARTEGPLKDWTRGRSIDELKDWRIEGLKDWTRGRSIIEPITDH